MIKPVGKNIVLEKEEKQETFINGIYLQEDEKSKSHIGKIIAISTEISKDGTFEGKMNSKVLYREYAGTEIECNNKKLVVIPADDILGVIEE
ncbi:co-chaperone GroES family protein [Spiroplasma endosymbiont of Polydrusus cervinus]|uniref:co-chaperone GroES family protein n=1 Tax=Spiroplasma endosymbiont of Polydrusus cervinus TaxID=3066287 RepID=UPI0030CFFC09